MPILIFRAENILRLVNQRQPIVSTAEKKLCKELRDVQDKIKDFQKALEQAKAKQNYHKIQVSINHFFH